MLCTSSIDSLVDSRQELNKVPILLEEVPDLALHLQQLLVYVSGDHWHVLHYVFIL